MQVVPLLGKVLRVRFCHECGVFQPPRSSHCFECAQR